MLCKTVKKDPLILHLHALRDVVSGIVSPYFVLVKNNARLLRKDTIIA